VYYFQLTDRKEKKAKKKRHTQVETQQTVAPQQRAKRNLFHEPTSSDDEIPLMNRKRAKMLHTDQASEHQERYVISIPSKAVGRFWKSLKEDCQNMIAVLISFGTFY